MFGFPWNFSLKGERRCGKSARRCAEYDRHFLAILAIAAIAWLLPGCGNEEPKKGSTPTGPPPATIEDYKVAKEYAAKGGARSTAERGVGGVLTRNRIPEKVLAKNPGLYIFDKDGLPKQEFRKCTPYFVFEEEGDRLLIGRIQDSDLASGWISREQCFGWFSRRLIYPKPDSNLAKEIRAKLGKNSLPPLDPTTTMPWPILHQTEDESQWLVLCDFSAFGGDVEFA